MPLRRALLGPTCVCLLLLSNVTGCATATIPAPVSVPVLADRCIVSYRAHRKGSPRRYAIGGRASTRDEVEQTVLTTKDQQAAGRRYARMSVASPWMFGGGGVTAVAGGWTAVFSHHAAYLAISAVGVASTIVGFTLGVTATDPLPAAITAFNDKALEDGVCDAKPFPPKPPDAASPLPSTPAPAPALPSLPAPNWTP